MSTFTLNLVVVPGVGCRQVTAESCQTVANFVEQNNLYGRDIIINGVGVLPQNFNTTLMAGAMEVFATGSVKGNVERTVTLVVVPGPGARQVTIDDTMTVASLVSSQNLHGRDIIINGVGISPSEYSTLNLCEAQEIFATGSVKGNTSRTITLVVVPGTGARQIEVDPEMTIAELVNVQNLHGRDIILDGNGILPSQWQTTRIGSAQELFATGSVKGNGAESFINVAYGDNARECFDELVQEAQYQHGHDPYNGTISTQQNYSVLKLQFNSRKEAESYAQENIDSVEKYYCRAVRFSENGNNGFVFYGWAAC